MALSKMNIAGLAIGGTSFVMCFITSIISFNCLADKKMQCAQVSGIIALITFCLMFSACVAAIFIHKN